VVTGQRGAWNEVTVTVETRSITPLAKANLRERVLRALRAAIVSGELTPGEVYSAPSLAATFGVSATPVREAMLDLAKENLVVVVPNKGFRVTVVDDEQLDQITAIRRLLEPPVVAEVTDRIPAEDFVGLRQLAQEIVDGAQAGDLAQYTEADRDFHLRLLGYSGNQRLVDLVAELRGQTRLVGLASLLDRGQLVSSAREHLELLDLMERRDAAAVAAFMNRHINHIQDLWSGKAAAIAADVRPEPVEGRPRQR
jgi:DNA-binding GntR family transcriptional regulator